MSGKFVLVSADVVRYVREKEQKAWVDEDAYHDSLERDKRVRALTPQPDGEAIEIEESVSNYMHACGRKIGELEDRAVAAEQERDAKQWVTDELKKVSAERNDQRAAVAEAWKAVKGTKLLGDWDITTDALSAAITMIGNQTYSVAKENANLRAVVALAVRPDIHNAVLRALEGTRAEADRLRKEVEVSDQIIANYAQVLDALPCPEHGRCVPHVVDALAELARLRLLAEDMRAVDAVTKVLVAELQAVRTHGQPGGTDGVVKKALKAALDATRQPRRNKTEAEFATCVDCGWTYRPPSKLEPNICPNCNGSREAARADKFEAEIARLTEASALVVTETENAHRWQETFQRLTAERNKARAEAARLRAAVDAAEDVALEQVREELHGWMDEHGVPGCRSDGEYPRLKRALEELARLRTALNGKDEAVVKAVRQRLGKRYFPQWATAEMTQVQRDECVAILRDAARALGVEDRNAVGEAMARVVAGRPKKPGPRQEPK